MKASEMRIDGVQMLTWAKKTITEFSFGFN